MDVQNYYKILDIKQNATQLDIETAYERSKILHETEQTDNIEWKLIREAYQILSDPQHRILYDEVLKQNEVPTKQGFDTDTENRTSEPQPNPLSNYGSKSDKNKLETPAWLVLCRKLRPPRQVHRALLQHRNQLISIQNHH